MTKPIVWRADLNELGLAEWGATVRRPDALDGSAQWIREDGIIWALRYVCPCGCKQLRHIPVQPADPSGWGWDENEDTPTLSPSIFHNPAGDPRNCGWHGHLLIGLWTPC